MRTSSRDRNIEKMEQMRGGKGHVFIERLLNPTQLNGKSGLYAKVTLEPNCSIGYHEHDNESETYYILSGKGLYTHNNITIEVNSGDVTFTASGNGHSMENIGDTNLVFMALILLGDKE